MATETPVVEAPVTPPPVADAAPPVTPPPAPPPVADAVPPVTPVEPPAVPVVAAPPLQPYTLAAPAGGDQWFDSTDLTALARRTHDKGLTREQAQAVVADQAAALENLSATYRAQTEADPHYGGIHLANTQRLGNLALDKLRPAGTPQGDALRHALGKTGLINHLAVVSFLADLGALMAEDRPGGPMTSGGTAQPDLARRLYPNAKS